MRRFTFAGLLLFSVAAPDAQQELTTKRRDADLLQLASAMNHAPYRTAATQVSRCEQLPAYAADRVDLPNVQ